MGDRSRPSQLLVLQPQESLVFRDVEGRGLSTELLVSNPTPYAICFKVKTTGSRRYIVRPKSGQLLPYSRARVEFRLREGACIAAARRDRFKLLSAVRTGEMSPLEEMWAHVPEAACMQSKLRVSLEGPLAPVDKPRPAAWGRRTLVLALLSASALAASAIAVLFDIKSKF